MDTELLDAVVAAPAIATRQGQRAYINFDNAAGEHGKSEVYPATGFYTPVGVTEDLSRYFKI